MPPLTFLAVITDDLVEQLGLTEAQYSIWTELGLSQFSIILDCPKSVFPLPVVVVVVSDGFSRHHLLDVDAPVSSISMTTRR